MPVIDAHSHIRRDGGFVSAPFFEAAYLRAKRQNPNLDRDAYYRESIEARLDPDGKRAIAMMDDAGVDILVTCPVDYAYLLGEAGHHIEEINEWYPELVKQHNGRIIYMAGLDPRRPNAVELFKKALTEWGAKGLKLHPTTGFYPNDPVCHPLYRLASEYGAVVLYHTGPSWMKERFAHPFYIDDAAADFPEMRILLGHTGGNEWWRDAMTVIRNKQNCYAELAGWQGRSQNSAQFAKDLGELRDAVGADRIVYGTDWPAPIQPGPTQFIKNIRALPQSGEQVGVKFTNEEVDAILGNNMARLLGI